MSGDITATTPTGPRVQRRVSWAPLPPEYAGFEVQLWVNAPQRLWTAIGSGDQAVVQPALQQVVLAHNGWLDFDGQAYPPAGEPAFWEAIPTELAAVILTTAQLEMAKLPNSLMPQKKRR